MRAVLPILLVAACGGDDGGGGVDLTKPVTVPEGAAPTNLSAFNLFAWNGAVEWNSTGDRVAPYELNTPLFSDYAQKSRALYLPDGTSATYSGDAWFELPVGTVIVKNFLFPADFRAPDQDITLVETRLLVHRAEGWTAFPYIWNAEQTDAVFAPGGEVRAISFTDATGAAQTANYLIPQRNQCENCHERGGEKQVPIGIAARHLNWNGQLEDFAARGLLAGLPATDVPAATDFRAIEMNGIAGLTPAQIDTAARGYLDINCAHCHRPDAVQGETSQLFLNYDNTDVFRLGACKRPGSAGAGNGGLEFDIVPGNPAESILQFRLETTQVGAMMPLLGRSLSHARGVELVRAWIEGMPPVDCAQQ